MLENMSLFCYIKNMEKANVDLDQEIIITCGDLIVLIEGLASMSEVLSSVESKIPQKENQKLLVKAMDLFVNIARLLPQEQKKEIFERLKEEIGMDLIGIL